MKKIVLSFLFSSLFLINCAADENSTTQEVIQDPNEATWQEFLQNETEFQLQRELCLEVQKVDEVVAKDRFAPTDSYYEQKLRIAFNG